MVSREHYSFYIPTRLQDHAELEPIPAVTQQVVASPTGLTQHDRLLFMLIFTPTTTYLELLLNLTCMYLGCGRKLEHPGTTHTGTARTYNPQADRPQPANRSKPLGCDARAKHCITTGTIFFLLSRIRQYIITLLV